MRKRLIALLLMMCILTSQCVVYAEDIDDQNSAENIIESVEETPEEITDNDLAPEVIVEEETTPEIIDSGQCGDNAYWEVNSEGTLHIYGAGEMYDYRTVPLYERVPWEKTVEKLVVDYGITSIGRYAFENCKELKEVELPESIILIGESAFQSCESLSVIDIPESVTSIGEGAFCWCKNLTEVTLPGKLSNTEKSVFSKCTSLTGIKLPENLTSIGAGTFYDCDSLTEIVIPESVTSIGKEAFAWCDGLREIEIPQNVTIIEEGLFDWCQNLEKVLLPENITSIEKEAFRSCGNLIDINLPKSIKNIEAFAFSGCSKLENVELPDGLTRIADSTFENCKITEIEVPETVTSIEKYAFSDCTRLIKIKLPEGLTNIGERAFDNCVRLKEIVIPENVTSMDFEIFAHCKELEKIKIPDSVTNIGSGMFHGCESLIEVVLPDKMQTIPEFMFWGCSSLEEIEIPDSVTSIGRDAFSQCTNLKSVQIPENITTIESSVFQGCKSLKGVKIPDGVTYIGWHAFAFCTGLTGIEVPERVTTIDIYAFSGCSNLEGIKLPKSLKNIEYNAFDRCSNLSDIYYTGTPEEWNSVKIDSPVEEDLQKIKIHYNSEDIPKDWPHDFSGDWVIDKEATCTEAGSKSYHCSKCGAMKNNTEIPMIGHAVERTITQATLSSNGEIKEKECTRCGKSGNTTIIYYPKSITLSTTNYTYTGDVRKPFVKVVGSDGKTISSSNYTVSYASGRKNIGRYAVKVTFKRNYSGSKTLYFTIGPKNPSSVTTSLYGHDDVQLKWNKVKGASGYVIYYKKSTASNYTKLGSARSTTTSYKKANLTDGTKYTFKVVAYKKDGKNNCYNAGKSSSIYTLKKISTPKVVKSGTKVRVSWTNIAGETGYQISQSTSKTGTRIVYTYKTTSGVYKTISATKGKSYYYKVRAYRQVGSKKVYGPWSTVTKYKR